MKTFLQGPKKKWWIANLCNGGLVQYPTTRNVLLYATKIREVMGKIVK